MRAPVAAALGLGLLLTGLLFGTDSLLVAGLTLLALTAIAAVWVGLAASGARLLRFAGRTTVVEGEPYPLCLELDGGRLPPPGGELVEPLLPEPLALGPGSRRLEREVSFPRRGCHELGRAELRVRDPFGLCERRVMGPDGGELLVLPRVEPIELAGGGAGGRSLGLGDHGSGGSGPDSWAAELEIDGLRPYREGTPAARIHWPTVARTGELHERRLVAGADAARVVVLDPLNPRSEEALDRAVRAAASLGLELGRLGGCTMLIGGEPLPLEIDPRLRAWERVLARLARVEPAAGPPPLNRLGRAGVVFLVSADSSHRPTHELRRLAAAARVQVAPFDGDPPEGALFTVAGCAGRTVGPRRGLGRVVAGAARVDG